MAVYIAANKRTRAIFARKRIEKPSDAPIELSSLERSEIAGFAEQAFAAAAFGLRFEVTAQILAAVVGRSIVFFDAAAAEFAPIADAVFCFTAIAAI